MVVIVKVGVAVAEMMTLEVTRSMRCYAEQNGVTLEGRWGLRLTVLDTKPVQVKAVKHSSSLIDIYIKQESSLYIL